MMKHESHHSIAPLRARYLAGLLLGLAGCNTVHGFGEDMSHLGNSISNTAEK